MATQYEHSGIKIDFDENSAQFSATINGKLSRSPSLAAIKKRIDAASASTFKPFKAIVFGHYSGMKEVSVTGIHVPRKNDRFNRTPRWDTSDDSKPAEVTLDTPANRDAAKAYLKRYKEVEKIEAKFAAELEAMLDAIPTIKPEDYKG